jgi:hypothetical protein
MTPRTISSTRSLSRGYVYITDLSSGVTVEGMNSCPYQAADILAGLAAGLPNYQIAGMYYEYSNGAGTATPFALTDTSVSRQGVSSPYDLVRAPLIARPVLSSTSVNYADNAVSFTTLTNATEGLNGSPFGVSSSSQILSVCLCSFPQGSTYTGDLLYARFILGSALPLTGTGAVSCSWPTTWV